MIEWFIRWRLSRMSKEDIQEALAHIEKTKGYERRMAVELMLIGRGRTWW